MLVQFFVPMLTVTISYCKIVQKLKNRMPRTSVRNKKNAHREEARNKKTNILFMAIALIFCLSWLPFHVFNIIVDIDNPFGDNIESTMEVYTFCHMLGMSSACSNPVLYGWLNDNFRKEFCEIYALLTPCRGQTGKRIKIVSSRTPGNSAFTETNKPPTKLANDFNNDRITNMKRHFSTQAGEENILRLQENRGDNLDKSEILRQQFTCAETENIASNELPQDTQFTASATQIFKISSENLQ